MSDLRPGLDGRPANAAIGRQLSLGRPAEVKHDHATSRGGGAWRGVPSPTTCHESAARRPSARDRKPAQIQTWARLASAGTAVGECGSRASDPSCDDTPAGMTGEVTRRFSCSWLKRFYWNCAESIPPTSPHVASLGVLLEPMRWALCPSHDPMKGEPVGIPDPHGDRLAAALTRPRDQDRSCGRLSLE
jgi:hypothetical protein